MSMLRKISAFILAVPVLVAATIPAPCFASTVPSSEQRRDQSVAEIRAVIQAQQEAWNRGDIDGFMKVCPLKIDNFCFRRYRHPRLADCARSLQEKISRSRQHGHAEIFQFGNHAARRRFGGCARPLEIETGERSTARSL